MSQQPGFLASRFERLGEPVLLDAFARRLWIDHFKTPIDEIPSDRGQVIATIKAAIMNGPWFEVYDLFEAILVILHADAFEDLLNEYLSRELAGFRIIDRKFIEVTAEEEVAAVDAAIADTQTQGAAKH